MGNYLCGVVLDWCCSGPGDGSHWSQILEWLIQNNLYRVGVEMGYRLTSLGKNVADVYEAFKHLQVMTKAQRVAVVDLRDDPDQEIFWDLSNHAEDYLIDKELVEYIEKK